MKGGVVRKREGIDAAGTGEVGREIDAAVGEVFARSVAFVHVDIHGDGAETDDVVPLHLGGGNVVGVHPVLGPVLVDVVETNVVLLHDDSAFNLKGLPVISGGTPRAAAGSRGASRLEAGAPFTSRFGPGAVRSRRLRCRRPPGSP